MVAHLYPSSSWPLDKQVKGRVLGRPPESRDLNGTLSPLPGAVLVSLFPGERQTDKAEPVGSCASTQYLVTAAGTSEHWSGSSGTVEGHITQPRTTPRPVPYQDPGSSQPQHPPGPVVGVGG